MPSVGNPSPDLPLLFEQMRNFAGGEDSFRDPVELDPDQCQHLQNIVIRDKLKARTRPGADAYGAATASGGAHPIRGLVYYNTPANSPGILVAASNAKLWKWDTANWTEIAGWVPAGETNLVEMAQGVDTLLLSDGSGALQVYDGAAFTSCGTDATTSPPVGITILRWHAGRMFGSGQAANPDAIWVSNRLAFGAGQWNTTSRSFRVGGGDGDPIVALASMPSFTLVVFKQNSVWWAQTDPTSEPADFSTGQANEEQTEGLGCVGKNAWCRYGNDLIFFSQDGIRSFQRMAAAAGQFELGAPISVPIQPYIDRVNKSAQHLICATKYRELVLFAVPLDASAYNNTVLVYNGRLGKWLGAWTGWTPAQFALPRFGGIQRLAIGDNAGMVNQWKDLDAADQDATYTDNGAGYASQLWTRSMTFGDLEADKAGFNARMRFNAGNANMKFTAVGNDADLQTFSQQVAPTGDILGTDVLPFLLASQQPVFIPLSLRGLPAFNELYMKIESDSGWWELRNMTCGARVRPMKKK